MDGTAGGISLDKAGIGGLEFRFSAAFEALLGTNRIARISVGHYFWTDCQDRHRPRLYVPAKGLCCLKLLRTTVDVLPPDSRISRSESKRRQERTAGDDNADTKDDPHGRGGFLFATAAHSQPDQFEVPSNRLASEILGPAQIAGPYRRVREKVISYGYLHNFTVDSDFGPFEVTGGKSGHRNHRSPHRARSKADLAPKTPFD